MNPGKLPDTDPGPRTSHRPAGVPVAPARPHPQPHRGRHRRDRLPVPTSTRRPARACGPRPADLSTPTPSTPPTEPPATAVAVPGRSGNRLRRSNLLVQRIASAKAIPTAARDHNLRLLVVPSVESMVSASIGPLGAGRRRGPVVALMSANREAITPVATAVGLGVRARWPRPSGPQLGSGWCASPGVRAGQLRGHRRSPRHQRTRLPAAA